MRNEITNPKTAVDAGETAGLNQRFWFACQRCSNCCRWPGFVRLTEADITRIAYFLGMEEEHFIQDHTRLHADRNGLALLDQPDGSCAMLDGRDCTINAVKPEQCSGFPNTWNFSGWREVCEAIPVPVEDVHRSKAG